MPGLIDTHWHLWTTLFRSMSSSSPETAYFALNVANGVRALPAGDLYQGSGSASWTPSTPASRPSRLAHNLRAPDHADANLTAHREIGLRGRFSVRDRAGPPGRPDHRPGRPGPGRRGVVRRVPAAADAPRPGRPAAGRDGGVGVPPGVRGGPLARPAGQLPRELDPGPGRAADDRAARGRVDARPAHAADPRALHDRRRARGGPGQRRVGQPQPVVGAAHRLRGAAGEGVARQRRAADALGRHAVPDRHRRPLVGDPARHRAAAGPAPSRSSPSAPGGCWSCPRWTPPARSGSAT